MATGEGLSRFYGYGFTNYDRRDGLGSDFVNDVTADRNGHLWAATNGGGVSRLFDKPFKAAEFKTNQKFLTFSIAAGGEKNSANWVNRIIFDAENRLWCVTDAGATPEAISVATIDIGMETEIIYPANLNLNNLAQKLSKSCLYICYFSAVMYHAVVCYVIDTGSEEFSVMDPNPDKGLITRKLSFFKEPVRLNRKMLIGWRVD